MPRIAPEDFIQANSNGVLHDANEPTVSPLNRGYLYGDAVYEVWRTYNRVIFGGEEHLARLHRSAESIHMDIPWSKDDLLSEIKKTTDAFRESTKYQDDLYIRLQIYRGAGPIGLSINTPMEAGFTVLVKPVPQLSSDVLEHGVRLGIAQNVRRNPRQALDPAWKTGNYLNNVVGLAEAQDKGFQDVLFLNLDDQLTEASTSNIAFIRGSELVTPPVNAGILPGITRAFILSEIANSAGLRVSESPIPPGDLGAFEEAMLLSTTKDIQPVASIDSHLYATGPNTKSRRLKRVFEDFADRWSDHNPDWRT